ncbi:hypothetical protein M378DRAFT_170829 [Amanita muscaria Koide BX008]|uniref:Uncharacterized protein n=1 Tax=Amanita muscaria (strain Koide BX008) TaxID=946122 RepID=A0A0C2WAF8_AMAMK|nr:hypothetical protein M378DRAFT_170829 [Amanita muscaria Koide BX008]
MRGGGLARQTIEYRQFSEPFELTCSNMVGITTTRRRELIHMYSREPHATSNTELFSFLAMAQAHASDSLKSDGRSNDSIKPHR